MEETIKLSAHEIGKGLIYRRFAFPARLIEPHYSKLTELGIPYVTKKVRYGVFNVPACIFYGATPTKRLDVFMGIACVMGEVLQECISRHVTATFGKSPVQLFVGKIGTVSVIPNDENEESKNEVEKTAYFHTRTSLEALSRLMGGINFALFAENREQSRPPLPDVEGLINVFPWSAPPGAEHTEYIERIFDLYIDKECNGILTSKEVPGRGVCVRDKEHVVAQIIGNNWYLLFSVMMYFNVHTTMNILAKVFAGVIDARDKTTKCNKPSSQKKFEHQALLKYTSATILREGPVLEKMIREKEKEVRNLRKLILATERSIVDLRMVVADTREGPRVQALLATLPKQLARIRMNKYVEGGAAATDGFMVFTRPVVLVHESKRYPMGKFTLYFTRDGSFYLWSDRQTHPKGYAHPHINEDGTPCLGNARSAIERAVVEHRYADAVDFITQWLFDGYDHNLAHNKVTEWPCEAEEVSCNT